MHRPKFVQENETHKILWGFVIQTVHLIPAIKLERELINKKENLTYSGPCRRSGPLSEKQKKKQKEKQVLGPSQRSKKAVEHDGNGDTNYKWRTWNVVQRLEELEIGEQIETI